MDFISDPPYETTVPAPYVRGDGPALRALAVRQPAPELIVHADCGAPYTSATCRACIEKAQARPGYARVGNPYDNAQAEAGRNTIDTCFIHCLTALGHPSLVGRLGMLATGSWQSC